MEQKKFLTSANIVAVFLTVLLGVANIFAQGVTQGVPLKLVKYPDTIFMNATIVTLDNHELNADSGSIVQAMAVHNDIIIALGTQEEIMGMTRTKVTG